MGMTISTKFQNYTSDIDLMMANSDNFIMKLKYDSDTYWGLSHTLKLLLKDYYNKKGYSVSFMVRSDDKGSEHFIRLDKMNTCKGNSWSVPLRAREELI